MQESPTNEDFFHFNDCLVRCFILFNASSFVPLCKQFDFLTRNVYDFFSLSYGTGNNEGEILKYNEYEDGVNCKSFIFRI